MNKEDENDVLFHFGVLGMRWGQRKAQVDLRSAHQKNLDKKKLSVDVAKAQLKELDAYARKNPGDAEAQIAAYRASKRYDQARGKSYIRLGKHKGETDAEYDARYDKEVETGLKIVAHENKLRAERKAKKIAQDLVRDERIVAQRKTNAQNNINEYMAASKKVYEKKGKKYDKHQETIDKDFAEAAFGWEKNLTVGDVRAERLQIGAARTALVLGAIGAGVGWYLSTKK